MGVLPGLPVNPTRSLLMTASVFVVCCMIWPIPDVWSQTVRANKGSILPIVYIGSVDSNRFPSSKNVECAPADPFCMPHNSSGPVPDALKFGYARELRSQALTVVESKPPQGIFYEVSVSAYINELPSKPPIVPKRFTCSIEGQVLRQGTAQKQKKFMINKRVGSLEVGAYLGDENAANRMLVLSCLKHSAQLVRKGIQAMTKS